MARTALITGVTGQDGAYLAKLLLEKGYEVFGAYRPDSSSGFSRLAELGIESSVRLISFDLVDDPGILSAMSKVQPDEVYNLAAQSSVARSFERPVETGDIDGVGAARILEAMRTVRPDARFYQASTSEILDRAGASLQNEETPFRPRSPYGVAKLYAHWTTRNFRESFGAFACSGILFSHESPLRSTHFVTRKVTSTLALIRAGEAEILELGNLDVKRDWGFAGDYVEGSWRMLQADQADDYVLATGRTETVRRFVELASEVAGFQLEWNGDAAHDRRSGRAIVRVNPRFVRATEIDVHCGDAAKAKAKLGWEPKVGLEELVTMMVEADLDRASRGVLRV